MKNYFGKNSNHPSIASSLAMIGLIYCDLENFKKSLKYQEKSL